MTLHSVRRVAWLALLAALMHVLLPAAHAMAGGGVAGGVLAGVRTLGPVTVPAAFCLSPGSPLEGRLRNAAAPREAGPSASNSAQHANNARAADGAQVVADAFTKAPDDPDLWVVTRGIPAPSHDTSAAMCPLCIAGAMAAVLPVAAELAAPSRTLSYLLAQRAVDVPAPGGVLLSFLSRGPPAQG